MEGIGAGVRVASWLLGDGPPEWGARNPLNATVAVWARERCRISPPRFLSECCKRQLNQGSFVLMYLRLFTFSDLY